MKKNLKVNLLSKLYGRKKALNKISFNINEGEILGLVGKNGAGKSTTLKILSSLLDFEGDVLISGMSLKNSDISIKKKIGYLSENNPLYTDLYLHEYLDLIGNLNGLVDKELYKRKQLVIKLCGLTGFESKKIKHLSKGYKQRLGVACAFIHDPEILILDEPTTGLDPIQIVEIRELIKKLSHNKIVIFSSHLLSEVNEICNRVIFLDDGIIILDSSLKDLKKKYKYSSLEKIFDTIINN